MYSYLDPGASNDIQTAIFVAAIVIAFALIGWFLWRITRRRS